MLKLLYNKAQSAIEFTIIVGFVLFFFLLFLAAIQASMSDKVKEAQELAVKDLANSIREEINLAYYASEGYSRQFDIPDKLGNVEYDLNIISGSIYVHSEKAAISLPIREVAGNIKKGENILKKEGGNVYLN